MSIVKQTGYKMSKILKDFETRRKSPAGDLIELQKNRVIGNWSNFKYCIQNKLPIYALADTQSGKTFFKFWLADQALIDGVVDNVIISTTNLTGAMTQIQDRAIEWAKNYGRQVKSTNDKFVYMVKGDIFINMTNANRTNRIDTIVEDAEKTAKKGGGGYKSAPPRILVILDEGEEFHELTETSRCDTALGNLLIHNKHNVSVVKVSATLLSHMLIHGQFSSDLGFLSTEQIYRIPNHPDYLGLNKKDFIEPVLVPETNFSGDCYTKKANLRNTSNIKIVVDQVESLILNQKNIGDDAQTRSLVQIGNVVFGRMRAGHLKVADMFTKAFQNKGRSVTLWDNKEFSQLNQSTEVVIVVHNGQAKDHTIAQKLKLIAQGWDRNKLKAIVIISKMMTGKSITVECENWYDPKSPEFGFYANFTAYYGPGRENITTAIQSMRCTGIRPELKKNVMWTTDDTKQDIENYRDQISMFISHLNRVGSMTETQMMAWRDGFTRPFTKAKIQKRLPVARNKTKVTGKELTSINYKALLSSGTEQLDAYYRIPANTYKKILNISNRNERAKAVYNFIIKKGFNDKSQNFDKDKTGLRLRNHKNHPDESSAIQAFTRGDDLQHHDLLINMHLYEDNSKYFVYAFNNLKPDNRPDYYIRHSIELSSNHLPQRFVPKLYHKNDSYFYEVC